MGLKVYLDWVSTTPGQGSRDAHRLLERLYDHVTGEPMPELLREPGGKPCFARGLWHCSITHTRKAAMCALSQLPIGLDAEPVGRLVSERTMGRVLSPGELQRMGGFPPGSGDFLTHWVLKEAYVKYTGEGLRRNPGSLDFVVTGERASLRGLGLCFRLLRFRGHIVALCAGEEMEIILSPMGTEYA